MTKIGQSGNKLIHFFANEFDVKLEKLNNIQEKEHPLLIKGLYKLSYQQKSIIRCVYNERVNFLPGKHRRLLTWYHTWLLENN